MELISFLLIFNDGNTFFGLDSSNKSFTNEVLDFDWFLIGIDEQVDGEMGSSTSHLEFETISHTLNHISNVGENGGNGTFLLSGGEPH